MWVLLEMLGEPADERCSSRLVAMYGSEDESYILALAEDGAYNRAVLNGCADNIVMYKRHSC